MRLVYFRGEDGVTNFGDELNRYLWPHFLSGGFDHDDGTHFVGIGTLLNDRLPPAARTIVFGAGVGYYGPPRRDETWDIYCVRGPLSARALGLDPDSAVTDPAALIARIERHAGASGTRWPRAFMPHWQSEPDQWQRVCAVAGIAFIDPRWPPRRVLDALHRTDLLVTEAMHGAIVADALRIPWIPVRTRQNIKQFKWDDWCQSVGLEYRPHDLPTIWPKPPNPDPIQRARRWAKLAWLARALARVARRGRPLLSRASLLETRVRQLEDRLERFKAAESWAAPSPTASKPAFL
jgi:succinoglycan biosynthesis protein ExoV